jgi:hypothetical protein
MDTDEASILDSRAIFHLRSSVPRRAKRIDA